MTSENNTSNWQRGTISQEIRKRTGLKEWTVQSVLLWFAHVDPLTRIAALNTETVEGIDEFVNFILKIKKAQKAYVGATLCHNLPEMSEEDKKITQAILAPKGRLVSQLKVVEDNFNRIRNFRAIGLSWKSITDVLKKTCRCKISQAHLILLYTEVAGRLATSNQNNHND